MSTNQWLSLSLHAASPHSTAESGQLASCFLESAEQGVWAIARSALQGEGRNCGQRVLASVLEQVKQGEDLTAAFLVAHGRLCREQPKSTGAELIAARLSRSGNSFELAWIGGLQAYLVRGSEVIPLSRSVEGGDANALLISTTRVTALGLDAKVRPKIDRKLSHAQRGDVLVLTGDAVGLSELTPLLIDSLKGMWSLEYKARKLQGMVEKRLASQSGSAGMPILLCRVK